VSIRGYIELIRLPNSVLSGLGALFAVLAYAGYVVDYPSLLLAFTTGFFVTGASMVVNDIVDLEVDKLNKPWKPIPRGAVSPFKARALAMAFLAVGVLPNLALSAIRALVAGVYALIGVSYSYLRRYTWSHVLVAISTTGPVVYGYFSTKTLTSDLEFTVLFSLTIFLVTLGREFLKAIQDYEGDKARGYRTIATVYGVEAASKIMIATCIAGVAMATTTLLLGVSVVYKAMIALAATMYAVSIYKAYKERSKEALEEGRRNTLIAMYIGTLAFWLFKAPI
jgi:geranylgeranylglycerol-phosphate geranylgeranyltransferase